MSEGAGAGPTRPAGRVRIVAAAALGLALIAGVVLIAGSAGNSSTPTAAASPPECLENWNSDQDALTQGRHNRTFHLYEAAQVGYLALGPGEGETGASISTDPAEGSCIVVFPRAGLDPEIAFAGFVEADGSWVPLSQTVGQTAVAALQSAALSRTNATLTEAGRLEPT